MSFNLTAWKEQATTGLRKVGVNIKPFLTKKAPYIVYATLLAVAVAPLVLAAGSGYIAVVTALGALAGGAGGDMIAEQLQRWIDDAGKDPDDEALQAKIAEWISLQIAKNKDFIIDGDAILKGTHAIETAQSAMPPEEQAAFKQRLTEELQQMGNYANFAAQLTSGAIAIGENATATGAGAVIAGGDVGGDIETDGGDAGPGSGAIAHGKGATAAGAGSVIVKGNVTGGISTSNKKKPHA